jgi:hypothetical protein
VREEFRVRDQTARSISIVSGVIVHFPHFIVILMNINYVLKKHVSKLAIDNKKLLKTTVLSQKVNL